MFIINATMNFSTHVASSLANVLEKSVETLKIVQLPPDWFGTPTWTPFHCFWTPIQLFASAVIFDMFVLTFG